ncbi:hypothetical protein DL546_000491 [Coniochaeta pulveracea]|uniref:U1-type domain-containing protein n=1 Tax=Coniochaeta pulveracea TaxID=177199 RepID=A0A420YMM5_9PEZI|nr:hypothetical protein DL546_000491 [Coniochaeta pulveracea]
MSEYWKSTPKYWCKHCSIFVRDTKFDRSNHEATGKHQNAIKRSLRELHRNHEQSEREKDRAKREVERLNGVVSGSKPSGSNNFGTPGSSTGAGGAGDGKDERQRQLEQLAELGVSIPTQLRPELALAGEWSVVSTKVVKNPGEEDVKEKAVGVKRERVQTEEEKEEEDALKGLFKKPKRWGRDSRVAPEVDGELEELLAGPLVRPKKEEVKEEEGGEKEDEGDGEVKQERKDAPPLVKEESVGGVVLPDEKPPTQEEDRKGGDDVAPAVVFKKRKPKNVRQK